LARLERERCVTEAWTPQDTNTHQHHVIAHVLGATTLGYFVHDEVLYILLDIGFVWTIFLDGEMGLLPHPVTVKELEIDNERRAQIKADMDLLLSDNAVTDENLRLMKLPPGAGKPCRIEEVEFFAAAECRRFLITGEETNLAIETSLTTAEVHVYGC
jgi:hypothetical protein